MNDHIVSMHPFLIYKLIKVENTKLDNYFVTFIIDICKEFDG